MPLQNRVDPWGNLIAVNARGAWLGNRGILHNENREIVVPWRHKAWVTCQLEFKGRTRTIFGRDNYSELFFLDEATALSAGHRPCAECRRTRYNEFKAAWLTSKPGLSAVSAGEIDKVLHSERAARGGVKVTSQKTFGGLPDGTFIERNGDACLIWSGKLRKWSPQGYVGSAPLPEENALVVVLTPCSTVEVINEGFVPEVHETADS